MSTETRAIVRHLGGESGHRSFFGGTHSKIRIVTVGGFIVAGLILTPIFGIPGLAIGAGGAGLSFLLTANTHRGSILERRRKRRRWADRVQSGTDAYVPYEVAAWDQAEKALSEAKNRRARWEARRELAALRANPDGADGMGWLQMGRAVPGIAWHTPTGEQSYLSVVFSATGQLRGIESSAVMARAAEGWGRFLADRAVPSSLARGVQTLTRILPADTALQEFWVLNSLDPDAPEAAKSSYEEVLRLTGEDAMVQRHYFIVKWPLTAAFFDAAAKYGSSRDGWRELMKQEITSTARGLTTARLGHIEVLSARQSSAILLHQQNPSRPIDYVVDVHPARLGIPSHDEFSAHVVEGVDPINGASVEWWHRTAKITADAMATAGRTQLWMLALLIGSDIRFVRSVSFQHTLVAAAEAKTNAKRDFVRDRAAQLGRQESGEIADDDNDVAMSAAKRRVLDLRSGSQHHGDSWVGYVTISVRSRDDLAKASRQLEETCAQHLGIERLDWQDSFQAAASGTTWPIGRGMSTSRPGLSARFYRGLAGRSDKEAIS